MTLPSNPRSDAGEAPDLRELRLPETLLRSLVEDLSEEARLQVGQAVGAWIVNRMKPGGSGSETGGGGQEQDGMPVARFWSELEATFEEAGWARVHHARIHPGLVRLSFEALSEAPRPLLPAVVSGVLGAAGGGGLAVALLPGPDGTAPDDAEAARLVFGAPTAVARLQAALDRGLDEGAALASL